MVLINIDTLSDSELRCIAQQEGVEDWEDLSREDLIDSIEEIYEDENRLEPNHPSYTGHRYVKTLTNVDCQGSFGLPGVEELPATYNETCIHAIAKDANWAYVFWSISPQDQAQMEESPCTLSLRTIVLAKNGNSKDGCPEEENCSETSFDIDVLGSDMEWSIELPWSGRQYKAVLVKKDPSNGRESILAESNIVSVEECWLSRNPEALKDRDRFNVLVTPLVTKGGELINNRQVHEILEEGKEG